jgi:hypothetical protein
MSDQIWSRRISDATIYFEHMDPSNAELQKAIPELIRIIEELYPLREWQTATDNYLHGLWKNMVKTSVMVPNEDGEIVEADLPESLIDTSMFNRYVLWLFKYFQHEYNLKTQATISYAYALLYLTQYYNNGFNEEVDIPNFNERDVYSAIASENSSGTAIKSKTKVNTDKAQKTFADYLLCEDTDRKNGIIEKLKPLFNGAKGKAAATNLIALHEMNLIVLTNRGKQAIYDAVNASFGLSLRNQSYQPYITVSGAKDLQWERVTQAEINHIIAVLGN